MSTVVSVYEYSSMNTLDALVGWIESVYYQSIVYEYSSISV
jgi:hypothetical protein